MSISASLALGVSTLQVNQQTTATLTVSNSGTSYVNVLQVSPTALYTGSASSDTPPVSLGLPFVGPGAVVQVPPSGSVKFEWNVVPFAPSTGLQGLGSGTYSLGAVINSSDGSVVSPTAQTLTVNPIPRPGSVSLANSLLTASASTVASGSRVYLTMQAKNYSKNPMPRGGLTVTVANQNDGTSTGSLTSMLDNGNGTYTGTYTGMLAGTADTLIASINGAALTSSAPTVAVTPGSYSLSQSLVTLASSTVVSGATNAITLTVNDAAGNQLTGGGLSVGMTVVGGTGTGTIGTITDNMNGTYSANFTGVLVGSGMAIHATIASQAVTSTAPTTAVTVGAANKAVWLQQPTSGAHTVAISPAMTVKITDAAGNLTGSTANVVLTLTTNPGSATLGGTTTEAAIAGTATFSNITLSAVGTGYILTATPTSLTAAASSAFNQT